MEFQTFDYDRLKIKSFLDSISANDNKRTYLEWLLNEIRFDNESLNHFLKYFNSNIKKVESEIEIKSELEHYRQKKTYRSIAKKYLDKELIYDLPRLIQLELTKDERDYIKKTIIEFVERLYNKENPHNGLYIHDLISFFTKQWKQKLNNPEDRKYFLFRSMIKEWNEDINIHDEMLSLYERATIISKFSYQLWKKFQDREPISAFFLDRTRVNIK